MKIRLFQADKDAERTLFAAIKAGAEAHGHDAEIVPNTTDEARDGNFDLAMFVGVKSLELHRTLVATNKPFAFLDKPYNRYKSWYRVSFGSHNPDVMSVVNMGEALDAGRLEREKWTFKPWTDASDERNKILIVGSSAKYHRFYDLASPPSYVAALRDEIRRYTNAPIVYRPKPSCRESVHVEGTTFSRGRCSIQEELASCRVAITHGSNGCFEAMLEGVPCIVTGNGVTSLISSHNIDHVNDPYRASDEQRRHVLLALANLQWSVDEFRQDQFWRFFENADYIRRVQDYARARREGVRGERDAVSGGGDPEAGRGD